MHQNICISSSAPTSQGSYVDGPRWMPESSVVSLQERDSELRKPESFRVGSKQACPLLWRKTLSFKTVIPTSLKRKSKERTVSALLPRHSETGEVREKLPPKNGHGGGKQISFGQWISLGFNGPPLYCPLSSPSLAHTRDLQRKRRKQRQGNENYNSFFCNWWILVTCPSWCTQHSLLKLKMEKTILSNPNSIYPLDFYTELPLWTQIYSECSHNLEVSKLHVPPKCKIQRPMIKATT